MRNNNACSLQSSAALEQFCNSQYRRQKQHNVNEKRTQLRRNNCCTKWNNQHKTQHPKTISISFGASRNEINHALKWEAISDRRWGFSYRIPSRLISYLVLMITPSIHWFLILKIGSKVDTGAERRMMWQLNYQKRLQKARYLPDSIGKPSGLLFFGLNQGLWRTWHYHLFKNIVWNTISIAMYFFIPTTLMSPGSAIEINNLIRFEQKRPTIWRVMFPLVLDEHLI